MPTQQLKRSPRATHAVAVRATSALLALIATLLLARLLGADGFGSLAFGMAAANIAAVVGLGGLDQLSAREVGITAAARTGACDGRFLRWTGRAVLRTSILSSIVAGVVVAALPLSPTTTAATVAALIGVPALAMLRLLRGRLQGLSRTTAGLACEFVIPNVVLVLTAASLGAFGRATPIAAAGGYTLGLFAAAIAAQAVFSRSAQRKFVDIDSVQLVGDEADWRSDRNGFAAMGILGSLQVSGYVIVAGLVLSPAAAGSFALAMRIAFTLKLAFGPAQMVAAPQIAAAWRVGDKQAAEAAARSAARIGLILSAPLAAGMLFAPTTVISAVSNDFIGGAAALQFAAIGQMALVVCGPAQVVLAMTGYERTAAILLAASFAGGALLVVAGGVWAAAPGAAAGAGIGLAALALTSWQAVLRSCGLSVGVIGTKRRQRHLTTPLSSVPER